MRLTTIILLCAVVSATALAQAPAPAKRPRNDWNKVKQLRIDQTIRVTQTNGDQVEGWFRGADDSALRMILPVTGGVGSFRELKRGEVAQLWKIHVQKKPIPHGRLMLDSALGVAAGVGIGAIVDAQYPNGGEGYGKITFGLLGMVFGPLVDGIAGSPVFHRPKLVYEDSSSPRRK